MKRNKFSLSHYHLTSGNMGNLIPIGLTEVLPGDTFQHGISALIRMQPMLAPVMHPTYVMIHNWFVPHRLVWDDFENFITGGPDGDDASVHPTIDFSGAAIAEGDLGNYLGLPVGFNLTASALPFRGAALVWNEYYRDQDLQTELIIDTTSGADTTTETGIQNVGWQKDYFTTARPWEQKGTSVTIPLEGEAPVTGIGKTNQTFEDTSFAAYETGASGTRTYADAAEIGSTANETFKVEEDPDNAGYPNIYAQLSGLGIDINDLRESLGKQRYMEARARYGSRYVEYLRYLGIRPSDARLQRPEYLGGGRQTLSFSEVLQTAPDASTGYVGTQRGHGISAVRSGRYRRFFEEHGYVFSFAAIRPKTIYANGVHRTWNRTIKEDYHQKELEHIGQQAVLNKELYYAAASPDDTFGYQDRYDEYRRLPSRVSGEFATSALNFWHLARIFGSEPALNATFVKSNPTTRIFASTSTDTLQIMAMHSLKARRMLAKVATSHVV